MVQVTVLSNQDNPKWKTWDNENLSGRYEHGGLVDGKPYFKEHSKSLFSLFCRVFHLVRNKIEF